MQNDDDLDLELPLGMASRVTPLSCGVVPAGFWNLGCLQVWQAKSPPIWGEYFVDGFPHTFPHRWSPWGHPLLSSNDEPVNKGKGKEKGKKIGNGKGNGKKAKFNTTPPLKPGAPLAPVAAPLGSGSASSASASASSGRAASAPVISGLGVPEVISTRAGSAPPVKPVKRTLPPPPPVPWHQGAAKKGYTLGGFLGKGFFFSQNMQKAWRE